MGDQRGHRAGHRHLIFNVIVRNEGTKQSYPRLLHFDGCSNARDLDGIPTFSSAWTIKTDAHALVHPNGN